MERERPQAGSTDSGNSQEDRRRRSGDPAGLRGNREDPAGPTAAPHDAPEPLTGEAPSAWGQPAVRPALMRDKWVVINVALFYVADIVHPSVFHYAINK